MITQEMKDKNQGIKCRGKGFNCYNCKDKKECLDYEYNQQLEKDIKIQDRCIYPVEGLPYRYIILYSISGIDKGFSTVSDKEELTLTEIYKLIIEHEKNDNIKNCACGETSNQISNDSEVKEVSTSDLLKELLNNPRVESISLNIERVGAVEETRINAKLKEIPQVLYLNRTKIPEDIEEFKKMLSEGILEATSKI